MYRIKNWAKFQHYKDRNPPWIKLHYEMLSSRDWVMLDDRSRVLAVACMLIASHNEGNGGCVPDDPAYLQRVAYLNHKPDFKPLIECGFLVLASGCKQMLADACPETETETETETEPPIVPQRGTAGGFEQFWETYPRKIGKDAARKAWQRKRPPLVDVLKAIVDQKASEQWQKDGGQFIPNPATWINQGRWQDEIKQEDTSWQKMLVEKIKQNESKNNSTSSSTSLDTKTKTA